MRTASINDKLRIDKTIFDMDKYYTEYYSLNNPILYYLKKNHNMFYLMQIQKSP